MGSPPNGFSALTAGSTDPCTHPSRKPGAVVFFFLSFYEYPVTASGGNLTGGPVVCLLRKDGIREGGSAQESAESCIRHMAHGEVHRHA